MFINPQPVYGWSVTVYSRSCGVGNLPKLPEREYCQEGPTFFMLGNLNLFGLIFGSLNIFA